MYSKNRQKSLPDNLPWSSWFTLIHPDHPDLSWFRWNAVSNLFFLQVSTVGPPDETSSTSTAAVTEPPGPAISDVEAAVGLRSLHRKRIESPRLNQDMIEAKKVKTLPTTEDADAARLSLTPLAESVGYVTIDESDGPPMYFCFCGRSGPCEKEIDEHCRRHRRKEDVPADQLHLFCHHANCRYFALDNDDYAKHYARHNLIQTLFRRAAFAKKAINTAAVADWLIGRSIEWLFDWHPLISNWIFDALIAHFCPCVVERLLLYYRNVISFL